MEPNSFYRVGFTESLESGMRMRLDFPRHQFGETPDGGVLDQLSSNEDAAAGRD